MYTICSDYYIAFDRFPIPQSDQRLGSVHKVYGFNGAVKTNTDFARIKGSVIQMVD